MSSQGIRIGVVDQGGLYEVSKPPIAENRLSHFDARDAGERPSPIARYLARGWSAYMLVRRSKRKVWLRMLYNFARELSTGQGEATAAPVD